MAYTEISTVSPPAFTDPTKPWSPHHVPPSSAAVPARNRHPGDPPGRRRPEAAAPQDLRQRRGVHRHGKGDPDPQGLAPGLCADGSGRLLGASHHRRPEGRDRGPDQRVPGDRQRARAALHPAPRRPGGLPEGVGRADDRLCRLRRQPPVHHPRQSRGEPAGATVPHRLRPPAPYQGVGHGARRGRRRGTA